MTASEQTGDRELYRLVLAYNDFTNLLRESLNVIGHSAMICGNNAFRKHDVGGTSFSTDFGGRLAAWPVFSARGWSTLARETDARLLAG